MQRVVLRRQVFLRQTGKRVGLWQRLRNLAGYLGSWFLSIIAGYGYRPGRSILSYFLLVGGFAVAYSLLGTPPSHPGTASTYHQLQWYEALVVSLTAFHGRGFFAQQYSPGDPQSVLAAMEAVLGLLLEITFIATFTNRFFAR
jgi:hypothetical protein